MPRILIRGAGRTFEFWPVLLLIMLVIVPSIGILWFVSVANRNERLAGQARLAEAYRSQLRLIGEQFEQHWRSLLERAERELAATPAPQVFARLVTSETVDSVLVFDAHDALTYPAEWAAAGGDELTSEKWRQARRWEFELNRVDEAIKAYASLASVAVTRDEKAAALEAQSRCLIKTGNTSGAAAIVEQLSANELSSARDANGRLIGPNTRLLLLQHLQSIGHSAFDTVRGALQSCVNDYREPAMSSSQRVFLMNQLKRLAKRDVEVPTLAAEELAASFAAAYPRRPLAAEFTRSLLPDVWFVSPPTGRLTILCHQATIEKAFRLVAQDAIESSEEGIRLLTPDEPTGSEDLITVDAGSWTPGWRLCKSMTDNTGFNLAASQQRAIYSWVAILLVAAMGILALLAIQAYRRQWRLTRLKNDLVGAVSHELKTPLASIRLLVDTLLEAETPDPIQSREYLQLISAENVRLTRLVENFLTFSRMERGKRTFDFAPTNLCDVVRLAVEAGGSRFEPPQCQLTLDLPNDIPLVNADQDAMVTVVLNLLDNAHKFSPQHPRIHVHCQAEESSVTIEVRDHGIGMNRKAVRKVFQQFYQVDQRLNRSAGGCGLGLSIVKYIVDGHGGSMKVTSEPGRGSTFSVALPKAISR